MGQHVDKRQSGPRDRAYFHFGYSGIRKRTSIFVVAVRISPRRLLHCCQKKSKKSITLVHKLIEQIGRRKLAHQRRNVRTQRRYTVQTFYTWRAMLCRDVGSFLQHLFPIADFTCEVGIVTEDADVRGCVFMPQPCWVGIHAKDRGRMGVVVGNDANDASCAATVHFQVVHLFPQSGRTQKTPQARTS